MPLLNSGLSRIIASSSSKMKHLVAAAPDQAYTKYPLEWKTLHTHTLDTTIIANSLYWKRTKSLSIQLVASAKLLTLRFMPVTGPLEIMHGAWSAPRATRIIVSHAEWQKTFFTHKW